MQIPRCNSCRSTKIRQRDLLEAWKYAPGKRFRMMHCLHCGLDFLHFGEGWDDLWHYYPQDYEPHRQKRTSGSPIRQKAMGRIRAVFRSEKEDAGTTVSGLFRKSLAWAYNKLAYRSVPFSSGTKEILDIGCGAGEYLSMMRQLGWKTVGVEPGKKAALQTAERGITVHCGPFETIDFGNQRFDVITMWHVLEHIPEPRAVLEMISHLLRDDGYLVMGVPNYDSVDRRFFGEKWNGFELPLHLYHFNPDSVSELLNRTGFRCQSINHLIRPADTAKSMQNILGCHGDPVLKAICLLFALPLAVVFSLLEKSSVIVVTAKKKDS
jgi:2-polyprenyl-3-methyl-5-hydroxy-6-metoxy-1,4-benzoquinol methylase